LETTSTFSTSSAPSPSGNPAAVVEHIVAVLDRILAAMRVETSTTAMVQQPPISTAGMVPKAAAAAPARKDGKRLEKLRRESNGTAVIAIRRVAGGQKQPDARNELNEPDQAELKWAARQLVHQPADGDGLDLQRNRRRDPHIEEADVGAVAK
jgi:hypothetical protein